MLLRLPFFFLECWALLALRGGDGMVPPGSGQLAIRRVLLWSYLPCYTAALVPKTELA